tara:strand:- start:7602 stop:8525 length:924 start_codon:yes stop_codon:yes gene_type:complete
MNLSNAITRRILLLTMIAVPTTLFFCMLQVATTAGVPFLGLIFWQCLAGAVAFGLTLIARRTPIPLRAAHMRYYGAAAVFGLVIPYLGMTYAAANIPVGILGMVFTIEPALTYLIALILIIERYQGLRFAGLLIGIAGLLLILLPQSSLPSPDMLPWVLVALSVPVSWALWSNWMHFDKPPEVDSAVGAGAMMILGSIMLAAPATLTGEIGWLFGDQAHVWWVIPVFSVLNVWLWLACLETIRLEGPVFYSTWTFIGTPLSIAFGMMFFAERHSLWIWSALILLFASLYLVNRTMIQAQTRPLPDEV